MSPGHRQQQAAAANKTLGGAPGEGHHGAVRGTNIQQLPLLPLLLLSLAPSAQDSLCRGWQGRVLLPLRYVAVECGSGGVTWQWRCDLAVAV
jgi:hypothetical protein